ncbi:unnamed protein product [Medioppia subpectinata]|uniref:NR LBD domain-containing protein n=1 Tax=Medioppia subpectinata TaxID=1979941 RepID=A0A7R9PZ25_9ACAR|nr:unnamed protein product [Medioppia subpectinata]CAG2105777.1 unnamed protein product [Medioppia subpectinata]
MIRDNILNDKQREFKKAVAEENRKIRQNKNKYLSNYTSDQSLPQCLPNEGFDCSFQIITTEDNDPDTSNSQINIYYLNETLKHTPLAIEIGYNMRESFNELETNKLTELLRAMTVYPCPPPAVDTEYDNMIVIRQALSLKYENEIKNMVNVMQKLPIFGHICDNDRIALVKYGFIEIFLLRSVLGFNFHTQDMILTVENDHLFRFKLDLLRTNKRQFHDFYKQYLYAMGPEIQTNTVIIDLFTAISLFSPNRPNLINKDIVKLEQQIYIYLLKRYLLWRYQSESEASVKLLSLLNIYKEVQVLGQIQRLNSSENLPQYMGPLLREVFDINADDNSFSHTINC